MSARPMPTPESLGAFFAACRYRTRQQLCDELVATWSCTVPEAEAAIDRCWREGWLFAAVFTVFCKRTGRLRLTTWFRPGAALREAQHASATAP